MPNGVFCLEIRKILTYGKRKALDFMNLLEVRARFQIFRSQRRGPKYFETSRKEFKKRTKSKVNSSVTQHFRINFIKKPWPFFGSTLRYFI